MGYNTRRKSLSLPDMGIALPKRSRTQSHPSPPSTIAEGDESEPPAKKSRLMSPPATKEAKQKGPGPAHLSPPPSPVAEGRNTVDVEGISDDIVVGTIRQLEQTGNRPHLVKELATVLASNLHCVEKYDANQATVNTASANTLRRSANPSALISSRLTAYLHRSWPAISPCPLVKDLSPVHPRRLYFFLTTMPRQPIPDTVEPVHKTARVISPSLSSASVADDEEAERYNRRRQTLSPSPEVDLSSPELDEDHAREPPTPGAPFSGRNSVVRERSESAPNTHGRRGGSPQLEHEERDFKQTANALYEQAQQRRNSQQSQADVKMEQADTTTGADQDGPITVATSIEEDPQPSVTMAHHDDENALFGQAGHLKLMEQPDMSMFSSPLMQPQAMDSLEAVAGASNEGDDLDSMHLDSASRLDGTASGALEEWETLRSPENVELAELEDLFDAY